MSKVIALEAKERKGSGKGPARELRRQGRIPAIIYGGGKKEVIVSLNSKDIETEYHKMGFMSHLIDITVGKTKYRVLPKSLQLHPVSDLIEHADFIHISENSKVKVMVAIEFANKDNCTGIKRGGVLNVVKHEVELACSADSIPESVVIDIENLEIGQSTHLSDIKLAKGVELTTEEDLAIATVVGRAKEEEAPRGGVESEAAAEDAPKAEGEEGKK
jgi:large subunit ribosomal protein L25